MPLTLFLFVIMWQLIVVAGNTAQEISQQLTSFMESYESQHSVSALRNDSSQQFCNRIFAKPEGIQCGGLIGLGNQMTGALTGIINAMILNYTQVSNYAPIDCDDHLTYKPWIPYSDLVINLEHIHGCEAKFAPVRADQHNELYFFKSCFSEPIMPPFAQNRANILF